MSSSTEPSRNLHGSLGQVLMRAVEQSPSIVLITDLKGIVEYVNPKFCELTGYIHNEVVGVNIRFLKSGQMDSAFYADLWKAVREHDEWRGELHNRKKSGEFYWEAAVISAVRNDQGIAEHYLKVAEDVTRLKKAEEQRDKLMEEMRLMAMQDALTGLYSRRMFDDELNRTWKTGERHDSTAGLLVIDIDYFKTFNDTYGHQVGDQILVEAAHLIQATARSGDIVCRYGGDEIVIILPMTSLDATCYLGARLLQAFRNRVFCRDTHNILLTVSVGAAAGSANSEPALKVLMRADQALYEAKRHGRNVLCVSDPKSSKPFIILGGLGQEAAAASVASQKKAATLLLLPESESTSEAVLQKLPGFGFDVLKAHNVSDAVRITAESQGGIDIALLDEHFRSYDENDLLKQIWRIDDAIAAVIMVSASHVQGTSRGGRQGGVSFIRKPISSEELNAAVDQAEKQRRFMLEDRRYQRHLHELVSQRSDKLQSLLNQSSLTQQPIAQIMAVIFNAYDRKTGEHCKRVEHITRIMAEELHLSAHDKDTIEQGAFLHDIGKIGIPDSILMKSGPLTLDEWKTVRLHPQIGYDLLHDQPSFETAALLVLEHHERYDGSGYPDGKKGSKISMGARMFAIADTYDALRGERPYAPSTPAKDAAAEIKAGRGTFFDPEFVDAFLRCQPIIEKQVFGS